MDLSTFESRAEEIWESLPDSWKHGVVAMVVDPDAQFDPEFEDTPLLGECMLDPAVTFTPGGPVRSIIHIYHGSFVEVAEREPDFDWDYELEETIRHELQHHLDWRQGHDRLGDEDDLQRENLLRLTGKGFDRTFYRNATQVGEHVWVLDSEAFFEVLLEKKEWGRIRTHAIEISWRGWIFVAGPVGTHENNRIFVEADVAAVSPQAEELVREWRAVTVVYRRKSWWMRRKTGGHDFAWVKVRSEV